MWRYYIRYNTVSLSSMSPSERANWTACNNVYSHLSPEWQTVVRLYYQRVDLDTFTIEDYCAQHHMTMAVVWHIIRSVQTMAAEERGLIDHRERKPYRVTSAEDIATANKTMSAEQDAPSAEQSTQTQHTTPAEQEE